MSSQFVFFTGAPGSRWSAISQAVECAGQFDTTDRVQSREFAHHNFSGHVGAYFGRGMEFDAILDEQYLSAPWSGCGRKLIKSHDWAYQLDDIRQKYPQCPIILVYRPTQTCFAWWFEVGGFNIKYPDYTAYKDPTRMMGEIAEQNQRMLEFAAKYDATWNYFTPKWCEQKFGQSPRSSLPKLDDVLITII